MAAERPSKRACQDTFLFTSESVGEGHPGTCKANNLERGGGRDGGYGCAAVHCMKWISWEQVSCNVFRRECRLAVKRGRDYRVEGAKFFGMSIA